MEAKSKNPDYGLDSFAAAALLFTGHAGLKYNFLGFLLMSLCKVGNRILKAQLFGGSHTQTFILKEKTLKASKS